MAREFVAELMSRVAARFKRDRLASELDEEMRYHHDLLERDLRHAGLGAADAHFAARRQFGNATYLKEESRTMWSFGTLETIGQDLQYALRFLSRSRGFTTV